MEDLVVTTKLTSSYNYKNWGYPEPNYREGKLWKAYKNLEKPIGTNSLKKHDIAHVRFFPKFLGR